MSTEPVIVDCARLAKPHISTLCWLARTQLEARRRGRHVRLRNASAPLLELIWLAGLAGSLRVEVKRQPEERKQPGGVEEEGELSDRPV